MSDKVEGTVKWFNESKDSVLYHKKMDPTYLHTSVQSLVQGSKL